MIRLVKKAVLRSRFAWHVTRGVMWCLIQLGAFDRMLTEGWFDGIISRRRYRGTTHHR